MDYFKRLGSYTSRKSFDLAVFGAASLLAGIVALVISGSLLLYCAFTALAIVLSGGFLKDTLPVMLSVTFRGKWPTPPRKSAGRD